ncbi:CASP8 and FADD-like apoptosis regulator isoform X1 [Scophthalmus maximus]|uniref:CASP8 and FADD-like apoptosis regulator n=1 Tax=Scophthalmus maximus TaxID=52904 RepID=A0A8D3AD06_SCOMX|nr:CASP8 and FADD-like apoptosis regulator isoform X1 [Scophthalmus maximus]
MALPDQPELQAINQVAESLSGCERRVLFYLCESLDTDHSTTCAKEMLRAKVMCHDRGRLFLAELLLQLRRFDILRKVCSISRDEVERTLGCQQVLPRFRVLMAHISEDMAEEDLNNVKFLISSTLSREKLEKAKNFLDVIIELEKLDLVSPERVDFVQECLTNIGRVDLAKKVATYKLSAVATPPQYSHQQESCRAPFPSPTLHSSRSLQQTRPGQSLHFGPETTPVRLHTGQSCQSPLDGYRFNSNPRGVCVIIDCVGNDGDMLEQTFKALHFNVALYKWLSVEDTLSALRGIFQQRENLKGDGLVCCLISRGTADHLLGIDSYITGLHLDSVRRLFTTDACPMMAGKPKLFFIQTYSVPQFQPCAGMYHQDEDLETDGCCGRPSHEYIPTDADVFWSHCWTDERQLVQEHHRSIYLKALTDTLLKGQIRKTKLVDIHTEVNGAIFEHNRRNPGANYHIDLKHTLRKDLYLQ